MKGTHQPTPCKRGDIVRVLPDGYDEPEFAGHIAVVTSVDRKKSNGGYPYQMHLVDHPYDSEIWFERYEVLGNVTECVELLRYLDGAVKKLVATNPVVDQKGFTSLKFNLIDK